MGTVTGLHLNSDRAQTAGYFSVEQICFMQVSSLLDIF